MRYLKEGGKIVIITTLDDKGSCIRRWLKPRIRLLLGDMNDFGVVTLK